MNVTKDQIAEKIDNLPELALQEALVFLDFLSWRYKSSEGQTTQNDPLLSVIGTLSGEPISALEIEAELYGKE